MPEDIDAILKTKPAYGTVLYYLDEPIYKYSPWDGWSKIPKQPEFDEETEKRRDEWSASLIN